MATSFLFSLFLSVFFFLFSASAAAKDKDDGICDLFVRPKGFQCTKFTVRTDDYFVLSLQRISSRNVSETNDSTPVFLYHGIMQGGEVWVLNEAKESLGFILAEQGYDVWIGNTRSSVFSAGHLFYSPIQKEYWDWSFDDIVAYDLPSMLRFIRSVTKTHIIFVGYSQGSMVGFAAMTHRKVSSMIEKAVMLSPTAYLSNVRSSLVRVAANLFLDQLNLLRGVNRFSIFDNLVRGILRLACSNITSDCYDDLLTAVQGPNCCINQSRIGCYNKYELQSTSMKNIVQLAQFVRSGRFCKYDRGFVGNLFHYWTFLPPPYSLQKIRKSLPLMLAYGGNDYLVDNEDLMSLKGNIGGCQQVAIEMLFLSNYSHSDFLIGQQAHVDVYPAILSFLRRK